MTTWNDLAPRSSAPTPTAAEQITAANPDVGTRFGMGLRSGAVAMGGQLTDLASAGLEAAGADGLAAQGYGLGKRLGLRAAEMAPPDVDVTDVDSALRYGAGLAGGAVPAVGVGLGAALATGGASIPAQIAAGTAAGLPFEAGDVVRRQLDDPALAERSAGERLTRALGAGGVSSLVQNAPMIAPFAAAGKGLRAGAAQHLLAAPAAAAGGMGAGEAAKQYGVNPDAEFDTGAIADQAIAGGVLGGAVGGASMARQAAGSVRMPDLGAAVPQPLADAAGKAKEALKGVVARGDKAAVDLGQTLSSQTDGFDWAGLGRSLKTAADDSVTRMKDGLPLGDLKAWAEGSPTAEMLRDSDLSAREKAAQIGQTLLAQGKELSQQARQTVTSAMSNLDTPESWQQIAAVQHAQTMAQTARTKINGFYEWASKQLPESAGQGKQSKDFSGAEAKIQEIAAPYLDRIAPGLEGSPQTMRQLVSSLRMMVDALGGKVLNAEMSSKSSRMVHDVLGDDAPTVLASIHEAVGAKDPAASERFYRALDRINAVGKRERGLDQIVNDSLTDEARASEAGQNIGALVDHLRRWTRGEGRADMPAAKAQFLDTQIGDMIDQAFGKNADKVRKALEKDADAHRADVQVEAEKFNEDGSPIEVPEDDRVVMGEKLVMSDEAWKASGKTTQSRASVLMKEAQVKHPDRHVRFMPARELAEAEGWSPERLKAEIGDRDPGSVGRIVAEKMADESKLNEADLKGMRLDTKRYSRSAERIDVTVDGEKIGLDARRITNTMHRKLDWTPEDELSGRHRKARAFAEGVAALTDHYGQRIDVRDDVKITHDMTWGEAQGLLKKSADALGSDEADARGFDDLNKRLVGVKDELAALDKGATGTRAALIAEGRKLEKKLATLRVQDDAEKGGRTDTNQDANVQTVSAAVGSKMQRKVSEDGSPIQHGGSAPLTEKNGTLTASGKDMIRMKLDTYDRGTAAQKALATKAKAVLARVDELSPRDQGMFGLVGKLATKDFKDGLKMSEVAPIITEMHGKLPEKVETAPPAAKPKMSDADFDTFVAKEEYGSIKTPKAMEAFLQRLKQRHDAGDMEGTAREVADHMFGPHGDLEMMFTEIDGFYGLPEADQAKWLAKAKELEGTPDPKAVAAKRAAFLETARSGDKALIDQLKQSNDAKGLQRAVQALNEDGQFNSEALMVANERLSELVQNPDVAYALQTQRYSMQGVNPQATNTQAQRANTEKYIERVLGKSVEVEWANIMHAGDFTRIGTKDVIRISVHALDTRSAAYHESVHAFFQKLRDAGLHEVTEPLLKAANSAPVKNQLRQFFKDQPDVLKQIEASPEERVAYMYQLHQRGQLTLGDTSRSILTRLGDFLRKAMGVWTNDQRALHIMDYFHSGEFAKNMTDRNAVAKATMGEGRNAALDKLGGMTEQFTKLGEAVASAGITRLRDTNVPALQELADLIKREGSDGGDDPGFIPAARLKRTETMNALARDLNNLKATKDVMDEALESLHTNTRATSSEARAVAATIKKMLRDTRKYMLDAGVKVGDLGADYFPRVWDAAHVSSHQVQFRSMLQKYIDSGQYRGDPDELVRRLAANDGNEFLVVDRPGMQHAKERVLSFISHEDAAPFLNKELLPTINSYVTQAARRAEWARRLGDKGEKLNELLARATEEGATAEQLADTRKFLRGVDGTLGDDLNPEMRRLMGTMVVYQNVRLLPLAVFSSVVDPMGIMVRGGTVGDAWGAFKRGITEIPKNFRRDSGSDAWTQIAEDLGVIDNTALTHALGGLYTQGNVGEFTRNVNDAFFRFNLMEQFNTSMRVSATQAAVRFIDRHADGAKSKHSARWLAELGLTPDTIKRTADGSLDLTDAAMRTAVNKWVDGAVLRPDAADKPVWMNDPTWMLVAHLKQFMYSFQQTILKRVGHEMQFGNYHPAMALLSYVPVMIASDLIKGMVQGGGEQPDWKAGWDAGDYLWSGVQRAGLLGVGQFGADVVEGVQRGGTGLGSLAGPTVNQLADAVAVLGGRGQFDRLAIDALPANALYAEYTRGGSSTPDPVFVE